ncbi:MAG: hypothetical protein IKV97_01865, partial [Clostridia bacterium]|nr:hypothetical protein [Clostridia bacterium]
EMQDVSLDDKYKNMPCHYANHINTGEPIHEMLSLDANMRVMAILDAAIRSSREGGEAQIIG